jgi:hypothetical protein
VNDWVVISLVVIERIVRRMGDGPAAAGTVMLVYPGAGSRHNAGRAARRYLQESCPMSGSLVPVKTAAGQQELAERTRRLSQRHRTLLLLVDGRRTLAQVLQMAQAAGVPPQLHEELVAMGLVALPQAEPEAPAVPESAFHIDLPLATQPGELMQHDSSPAPALPAAAAPPVAVPAAPPAAPEPAAPATGESELNTSLLPAAQSLMPESSLLSSLQPNSSLDDSVPPGPELDPMLEQARELMLRTLRNEAPVSGALTMRRVRRAASREELYLLLDELEQRVRKPRKRLVVEHTLRQLRHRLQPLEALSSLSPED